MERETDGGRDFGRNAERGFGDEPAPAIRDAPPDYLAPIDEAAPVSGHLPPPAPSTSAAEAPEHDWPTAAALIYPTFRPVGTQGMRLDQIDRDSLAGHGVKHHTQPLVDEGLGGLPVVYSLHADGFDVIVNVDHLLTWGIRPDELQEAALRNLGAWSARTPWTDEVSGERRLLTSESGEGWDAARILLPEVREHIASTLGSASRILIGLPERHLLLAGTLRPDDPEFAGLFAEFVLEHSGGADEPIDRRVFELVDGRLVEFAPIATS